MRGRGRRSRRAPSPRPPLPSPPSRAAEQRGARVHRRLQRRLRPETISMPTSAPSPPTSRSGSRRAASTCRRTRRRGRKYIGAGNKLEPVEVRDLRVQVGPSGDAAVATYVLRVTTRPVKGEVAVEDNQETDVLFKRDGRWASSTSTTRPAKAPAAEGACRDVRTRAEGAARSTGDERARARR